MGQEKSGLAALPAWLWVLDFVAVALIAVGVVRLFVPGIGLLDGLSETAAWACVAIGAAVLVLFWVALLRLLRARQAARR
jgi:zinc transporter ZupT